MLLVVLGLHCCRDFSVVAVSWGLLSSCGPQASHRSGFSHCRARALEQSQQLWLMGLITPRHVGSFRIRDLPGSGIKPVCPALMGRFFTTELPEKPKTYSYMSRKTPLNFKSKRPSDSVYKSNQQLSNIFKETKCEPRIVYLAKLIFSY